MDKLNSMRNKFYITTAIDYVNDKPHLGHALEKVQADVIARYNRLRGRDVFFLTGTDEHGIKIANKAKDAKKSYRQFVDDIVVQFKELTSTLNISNNYFIRTTDRQIHWPGVYKLWNKIDENGDLYKSKYKGLYCTGHESFLEESELNENGLCPDHQSKPEVIEEENYFFRLSRYSKQLENLIEKDQIKIFPQTRKNEILAFVKRGLRDVSFSRTKEKVEWGINVPNDDSQTIYVWVDALINYISAVGYGRDEKAYEHWWPADVHLIGKDILRFHAAIWLGMLLSAGLELPKSIFVHGFITVDGKKMSKTIGNVVDPLEVARKYGVDALRYYLLREIPSGEDGDFTYEKFEERYSADLAKGIGNLTARILTLAQKGGLSAKGGSAYGGKNKFASEIAKIKKDSAQSISEFKFNEALEKIWRLITLGDKYIDVQKPWTLESDSKKFKEIIGHLLFLLLGVGELLIPFMPETADKIAKHVAKSKSTVLFPQLK